MFMLHDLSKEGAICSFVLDVTHISGIGMYINLFTNPNNESYDQPRGSVPHINTHTIPLRQILLLSPIYNKFPTSGLFHGITPNN
jgi:hypothetical protein